MGQLFQVSRPTIFPFISVNRFLLLYHEGSHNRTYLSLARYEIAKGIISDHFLTWALFHPGQSKSVDEFYSSVFAKIPP